MYYPPQPGYAPPMQGYPPGQYMPPQAATFTGYQNQPQPGMMPQYYPAPPGQWPPQQPQQHQQYPPFPQGGMPQGPPPQLPPRPPGLEATYIDDDDEADGDAPPGSTDRAPKVNVYCPKRHLLRRCRVPFMWCCEGCQGVKNPSVSNGCRQCDYDLCVTCVMSYAANAATQSEVFVLCPKRHRMALNYIGAKWTCDGCKQKFAACNSFGCRQCNYDMCTNCAGASGGGSAPAAAPPPASTPPPAAQAPPPSKPPAAVQPPPAPAAPSDPTKCPKGHTLRVGHVQTNWSCDRCKLSKQPAQSHSCRTCNYDVCGNCLPLPAPPAPAAPPAVPAENTVNDDTTPVEVSHVKGKVKLLLIGINYTGTRSQLSGCVNDVRNMYNLLQRLGIKPPSDSVRILVDDAKFPSRFGVPTRKNIESGIAWLVEDAAPGDFLFFHFSGHGSQASDAKGNASDEDDGFDETLVPSDYEKSGMISDDFLFNNLCKKIPAGCRLTGVTDCCHSGSAFDLPYLFHPKKAAARLPPKARDFKPSGAKLKACEGDVLLISGCKDAQTSADVSSVASFFQGPDAPKGAGGACTSSLMKVLLKGYGSLCYEEVLEQMLAVLDNGNYSQLPQMSASKDFDFRKPFSMDMAFS